MRAVADYVMGFVLGMILVSFYQLAKGNEVGAFHALGVGIILGIFCLYTNQRVEQ